MDEKILEIIKQYVEKRNDLFNSDSKQEIIIYLNYIKINDLLELKKNILTLMDNDKELFKLYLKIGISLSNEDYKLSERYKNEILEYAKKNIF
jgi:hypothetical protein